MYRPAHFVILLLLLSVPASAVPPMLPHLLVQPIAIPNLLDARASSAGLPVPDGSYPLVLSIWDSPTGGSMLWSESHVVTTEDGLFSVEMGSVTPIPLNVIAPDTSDTLAARYLQMDFNGETIQPRSQLGGLPYASAAMRMRGDFISNPGVIDLRATEELFGNYNFLLENSSAGGAHLTMDRDDATAGVNVSVEASASMSASASNSGGTEGMTVELSAGQDAFGDPEARLEFFGTDNARAKKTREIVVVGSKVKEVIKMYESATTEDTASHEYVSGRATGKRMHSPFKVSGAVLPESTPGYELRVDSSGSELMMAKNNTDGSSCWIRVAQTTTGGMWETNDDDVTKGASSTHRTSPGLLQYNCKGSHVSGDTTEINEFVSYDSGYQREVVITNGTSKTTTVDAADYALWQRHVSAPPPSAGGTADLEEMLGTDSGYSKHFILDNGSTKTETVMKGDFTRLTFSGKSTSSSGDTASVDELIGIDSGYSKHLILDNGSTKTETVMKGDFTRLTFSGKSSSSSGDTASVDEMIGVDSGIVWHAEQTKGGFPTWSDITLKRGALSESASFRLRTEDLGENAEVLLEATDTEGGLSISNTGASGLDGFDITVDSGGSTLELYEVLPARMKASRIFMQQTSASANLYVGNNGFGSSDGVNISSTPAAGARIGINTNTPSVALHVVGNICYTDGISACSDARYKKNIEDIDNALEIIEKLRGVRFDWRTDEYADMRFSDERQIGFIAQEVAEVVPAIVSTDADGYYSVDYVRLTPILVEAIKSQQKTIEYLAARVQESEKLTSRVAHLEAMVESLLSERDDRNNESDLALRR